MRWFTKKPQAKQQRLERQVLSLTSTIEARDRTIAVMQAEIDSMAGVIARDRQRVSAECAIASRQIAEAEGTENGRDNESIKQFSA